MLDPSLQQAQPAPFDRPFTDFATGYLKHFSGDQAESTDQWSARISGRAPPLPVMRIVVAVELANGGERVIGAIAVEYAACRALGPVRALLAEAEWPDLLESPPAAARASCSSRASARAASASTTSSRPSAPASSPCRPCDCSGCRPPPATASWTKSWRPPSACSSGSSTSALAQEAGAAADATTLARRRRQLGERRPLTAPLPRLRLEDVALSWHFVELLDDSQATDALLHEVRAFKCPVLHSMQTDLRSRAYRPRPDAPDAAGDSGGATSS